MNIKTNEYNSSAMDYKNAKIYKIVCDSTNLIYVGATCQPALSTRLGQHVSNYKRNLIGKGKQQCSSFQVIKGGNYSILLIEKFPCENKDELNQRERFHIESLECVNIVIPGRLPIEWRRENMKHIQSYEQEHRKERNIAVQKYRNINIIAVKERQKEWYNKNRVMLKARREARREAEI